MLMTQVQAVGVWCPMVRSTHSQFGNNQNVENLQRVPEFARCVGPRCGMWRWAEKAPELREAETRFPDIDEPVINEPERPADLPASWTWVQLLGDDGKPEDGMWVEPAADLDADHQRVLAGRRGYCGLAGAVQFGD